MGTITDPKFHGLLCGSLISIIWILLARTLISPAASSFHLYLYGFMGALVSIGLFVFYGSRTQHYKTLATRDPLTGLYNRRYFFDIAGKQLSLHKRTNRRCSLAILDVDYFKIFNDLYGHVHGDYVLKKLAETILTEVRESDLVARYGGEEFIILLPETTPDGALALINRIRASMEDIAREINPDHPITISGGISSYPHCGDQIRDLIVMADEALYRAKQQRDTVFLCPRCSDEKFTGGALATGQ